MIPVQAEVSGIYYCGSQPAYARLARPEALVESLELSAADRADLTQFDRLIASGKYSKEFLYYWNRFGNSSYRSRSFS